MQELLHSLWHSNDFTSNKLSLIVRMRQDSSECKHAPITDFQSAHQQPHLEWEHDERPDKIGKINITFSNCIYVSKWSRT
jgi:hypothetical protein